MNNRPLPIAPADTIRGFKLLDIKEKHSHPEDEPVTGAHSDVCASEEESPGDDKSSVPAPEGADQSQDATAILREQLERIAAERDEARDQLLRALAETQNVRRRMMQERDQIRQFATEGLVQELLPVLDNFERTLAAVEQGASVESLVEGVRAVDRQLRSSLESVKVTRIPTVGKQFDPAIHEAISVEPHPELPADTVISEIASGYRMVDRIIRPAKVRVSKGK